MNPVTIGAWIGVIVAAGGVIGGTVKFGFWVYDEWQRRRNHAGFVVPPKTLQIARKVEANCWWAMAKQGDQPVMQIVGSMFVSNTSSVSARIPEIELHYGFLGRKRVNGVVMVPRSTRENVYGFNDVAPNETKDAHFDFWIYPPVVNAKDDFIAHSIVFIDQFGNRHPIERVSFKSRDTDLPKGPKKPTEAAYEVADALESAKNIVRCKV